MVSLHGWIFQKTEYFWKNLRAFAFDNKTLFEAFFIALYSIEQLVLIIFSYKAKNIQELSFFISMFAVIVLATFSFHKLLMESRIRCLEKEVAEANSDKRMLEEENRRSKNSYKKLLYGAEMLISESLNTKEFYNKKEKRRTP